MTITTEKYYLRGLLVVGLMGLSLTACAAEQKSGKRLQTGTMYEQQGEYLPFAIMFDREGKPVVVDENRKPIEPTQLDFPIKTQAIRSVESVTTVSYEGSHMYLVKIGGFTYLIKLPH